LYYLIKDTLCPGSEAEVRKGDYPYVAVLTPEEWAARRDSFDMGIDFEPEITEIHSTKAEVNYDSLTGTFSIPKREDITGPDWQFAFALDEKGVVFIDADGSAAEMVGRIAATKKWRMPSLERFLYDFLEQIIHEDMGLLARYERELDAIEAAVTGDEQKLDLTRVNAIRGDMLDLRTHYEHLITLGEELEDNENRFFKQENVRYFRLFTNKVERLRDMARSLWDYTVQLRDFYQAQLDVKQNHIMTILTVVTTIFMPLTLITGWYGMNFKFMPELEWRWSYPAVFLLALVIAGVSLWYFKKKKWL